MQSPEQCNDSYRNSRCFTGSLAYDDLFEAATLCELLAMGWEGEGEGEEV